MEERQMNAKDAKKLKVGDRIQIFAESPDACTGTVIEIGYNALKTEWDDGQIGVIDIHDHEEVSRYYGTDKIVPVPKAEAAAA
jgi:hypothetical protein